MAMVLNQIIILSHKLQSTKLELVRLSSTGEA